MTLEILHSANGNGALSKLQMPDITSYGYAKSSSVLNRVGMSRVEIPVRMRNQFGDMITVPARADFYVSLDDVTAKGIHMSRLYLTAQNMLSNQELCSNSLVNLLRSFIDSQRGLSVSSWIRISFEHIVQRKSLLSGQSGWRYYPASFIGYMDEETVCVDKTVSITYSTTCPCSAALARQVIQKKFQTEFAGQVVINADDVYEWLGSEAGMAATPHGQRSFADIKVRIKNITDSISFFELISLLENGVQTPVQTAVKREDEQEFARINGANLMFCEDAARVLKTALDSETRVSDYYIKVYHLESLHAHDAVAIVTKGVPNGFQP